MRLTLLLGLGLGLGLTACGDKDDPVDSGEEADADTDTDSDSDSDSDTDTDSDADSDADTDSDTDADSDTDTDTDADTDPGEEDTDGDGYLPSEGDCDNDDPDVNPGATEICNGVDDNCDDHIDEGVMSWFYEDADADGYGDATSTVEACEAPTGYVSSDDDCDDDNDDANPGADEQCDGADNDCDGDTDEDDLVNTYGYSADMDTWFSNNCGSCHMGGSSSGGLAISYANIVGVEDSGSGLDFIEGGSTANSYIWHKIQGTQSSVGGSGSDMPKSGTITDEEECELREWIEQGASS